jgi:phage terminase small subunit
METHIADRIKAHLAAHADNVVVISTYCKAWQIQQKDVDKFAKAGYELITKRAGESGFYMQQGKSKVYCTDGVRFGAYK